MLIRVGLFGVRVHIVAVNFFLLICHSVVFFIRIQVPAIHDDFQIFIYDPRSLFRVVLKLRVASGLLLGLFRRFPLFQDLQFPADGIDFPLHIPLGFQVLKEIPALQKVPGRAAQLVFQVVFLRQKLVLVLSQGLLFRFFPAFFQFCVVLFYSVA